MNYTVTKIETDGTVAIRDYNCKDAAANNEDLHIHYKDQIMTVPNSEIKSSVKRISFTYNSKNKNGRSYKLWFFTWNSRKEEI